VDESSAGGFSLAAASLRLLANRKEGDCGLVLSRLRAARRPVLCSLCSVQSCTVLLYVCCMLHLLRMLAKDY
jgi:hypothetical protein